MQYLCKAINKYSFFRFLIIGGISTCIDFIIYMLLSYRISITKAKMISICSASVISFLLNRKWTFSVESAISFTQIFKYLAVQIINIAVNVSVNYFAYHMLGIRVIAFIIATGVAMVINYLLQKRLVFKVVTTNEIFDYNTML